MKLTVSMLDQDLRADALRVAAPAKFYRTANGWLHPAGDGAEAGRHHPYQGARPAPQRNSPIFNRHSRVFAN
jgi:hypothetical protein